MKHIFLKRFWPVALFGGTSIAFLILYYSSYYHFSYPSAPGGDLYNHFLYVQDLQNGGLETFFKGYPKLFHLLVLMAMKLTGINALRVMLYMIPVILLAVAFATSWVAFILKGRVAAIITFLLSLFVVTQPTQTLYDGGFPNTIAAGIIAPLVIGLIILYFESRQKKWLYLFFVACAALISTHAFTSVYVGAILCSIPFYYHGILKKYGLPLLAVIGLFFISPFAEPLKIIVTTVVIWQSSFPWIHLVGHLDNPNAIWRLIDYPVGIGYSIVYGGGLGFLYLIFWIKSKKDKAVGAYLLAVWIFLLFVGSRIEAFGFPVRLARDLAIPLTISAGVLCAVIFESSRLKIFGKLVVFLLLLAFSYHHFYYRSYRIRHYEPALQYSNADEAAVSAIGNKPAAAIDQYLPYVVRHNIEPVFLLEDGQLTDVDRKKLEGKQYAFFEVRQGHNGEVFRPLLVQDGFREIEKFEDPLKAVVLFQR